RHDPPRSEVAAILSRVLSSHAADAAVAATLGIAESFLPLCGRMRLAVEQALLVATYTHHGGAGSGSVEHHITTMLAPTAAALEVEVLELGGVPTEAASPDDQRGPDLRTA